MTKKRPSRTKRGKQLLRGGRDRRWANSAPPMTTALRQKPNGDFTLSGTTYPQGEGLPDEGNGCVDKRSDAGQIGREGSRCRVGEET